MTTTTKLVRVERDGHVATVTIDRQEKLNALNGEVVSQLGAAIDELTREAGIRCAILTGAGEKAFVAGADIAEMQSLSVDQARTFAAAGHAAFDRIENAPFPFIAAVQGFALGGGCELALACDFIYAGDRAKFGQPEVKLGVIPGFGGTQRLARRVGLARARELIYTGAMLDAESALRIGLVNAVVPGAELLTKVREVAKTIATMGPVAIAEAKRVIRDGEGRPTAEANRLEVERFAACFATSDQREGMAAFLGKRAPTFEGK